MAEPPLRGPVLGLESSCDETAAAVLAPDGAILAEAVLSQEKEHAAFGGVVPEIAARAHLAAMPGLAATVLRRAGLGYGDLAAVAATSGPRADRRVDRRRVLRQGRGDRARAALRGGQPPRGACADGAAAGACCPRARAAFPYLLLLVSGGHCQCVAVEGLGGYRRLGTTLDDAVGEAFDKAAKLMGLPWPGGPHLERLAATGNATRGASAAAAVWAGRGAISPSAG